MVENEKRGKESREKVMEEKDEEPTEGPCIHCKGKTHKKDVYGSFNHNDFSVCGWFDQLKTVSPPKRPDRRAGIEWRILLSNNDCDYCSSPAAVEEVASEIRMGTSAILLLRDDLTLEQVRKGLTNFLWLADEMWRRNST